MKNFSIKPIGFIRSELRRREEAPRQGFEGAPNAFIEVLPPYRKALNRMQVGDEIIVITWLHRAKRDVIKVRREATDLVHLQEYFPLDRQIVPILWDFTA